MRRCYRPPAGPSTRPGGALRPGRARRRLAGRPGHLEAAVVALRAVGRAEAPAGDLALVLVDAARKPAQVRAALEALRLLLLLGDHGERVAVGEAAPPARLVAGLVEPVLPPADHRAERPRVAALLAHPAPLPGAHQGVGGVHPRR